MTREEASFYLANMDRKYMEDGMSEALDMAIEALEQEPCGDAISRQAMNIELEKWITYGEYKYSNATKYLYDRIDRLPSVIPQPCGDAISRQEALNAITMAETRWQAVDNINKLPPVTPQPKTGQWIEHFDESGKWYECDQCHTDWGGAVNYCPNCGCAMKGELE